MKRQILLVALAAVSCASVHASTIESQYSRNRGSEDPALDLFNADASYVFESELSGENTEFGDQDAFQASLEYSHRFRLTGSLYLRAGLAYSRFEFGETLAPVPDRLQSLAAIVGLDYMVGKDLGAFLWLRPGFYTDHDFDMDSFNVPITVGRAWILQEKKLFLLTGLNAAFLRGQYPVLPFVGLIYYPHEQWTVFAVFPEPRVTYKPNQNLGLWLGGQLTGGSFRTQESATILPRRLSHAQVDYSEYRAGLGVDFYFGKAVTMTVAGGYAFQRQFDFERAGFEFETEAAPYVRAVLKAEF